ncbi:MAG: MogA/MoaB family molybdenum cofactor biosynthesis protein [Synergistaceae bacterium]|nr:MogA/MoaB family molybdenum cofactor biosynthesis protein [Synergistaceae bacterium]
MKWKIAGICDNKSGEWQKLIYVHLNSEGKTCVNGHEAALGFRPPGEPAERYDGFDIVTRDSAFAEGEFLSINDGETMLCLGSDKVVSVVCPGFVGVSASLEVLRPIRVGVLTVSDKGARGERTDTSGPALADMARAIGSVVERRDIVPDDRASISNKLKDWADNDSLELILVTGGTGLSTRDVTPEALMDIHDKVAPGFGEIMRAHAMRYTPRGFLSRSLAVTRRGTLIVALPGSERGVHQCFEAISPALRHGVETLRGWDSECGHS